MNTSFAIERISAQTALARLRSLFFILPLLLALAACGGGGGGGSPEVSQPTFAITQQPADQSSTTGNAATFRVAATANATFQWQRLGSDGQWADIPGATQAELSLVNLTEADNGRQYRAQVRSGSAALTSSVVTLRVTVTQVAAAVAAQPSDVQLRANQAPSFSVTATGTSLGYQWQSSTDGLAWTDIAGATAETLTLPAATLADSGRMYRVVVRNSLATVTSRAVTLSVLPALAKPLFTAQPQDRSIEAGQGATFTATASGEPGPTLQWETSLDGQAWTAVAGATTSTLVVANASLADNGRRYRAVARNSEGSETSAVGRLAVVAAAAAPGFVRQPQPAVVLQSQPVAFEAEASGNPTPTYQWQVSLDGGSSFTNVNGATGARLELATTVEADDGKLFRVVASNRVGDLASPAARLTVQVPPQVAVQPQDVVSGAIGVPVTVTVAGTGKPAPNVQWQVSRDGGTSYQDIAGAAAASYTWTPTAADGRRMLRARLSSAAGTVYSKAVTTGNNKKPITVVWSTFSNTYLNAVQWLDSRIAVAVGAQGVIARTVDAGASWQVVQEPMPDLPNYWRLAVLDARTVVAASNKGTLIRSEDAGLTWRSIPIPTTDYIDSLSFRNASVGVLSSSREGVFRTVDGGFTWTRIPSADPAKPFEKITGLALRGMLGFATGENHWFRSTDGGASWQAQDMPATSQPAGTNSYVAFSTDGILTITGRHFALSMDGGQNWLQMPLVGGTYKPVSQVRFSRDGQFGVDMYGDVGNYTSRGGMRSVNNGQSWAVDVNHPRFSDVDFSPDNVALGVGQIGGPRISTDLGATWGTAYGVDKNLGEALLSSIEFPDNDQRGIAFGAVDDAVTLFKTADGGLTWQRQQQFARAGDSTATSMSFADSQVGMVIASGGDVLVTTDGGRNWTASPWLTGSVNSLVMVDRGTALVAASRGLYRTQDRGATWTQPLVLPGGDASVNLSPGLVSARGSVALAPARGGGLYRSTDRGQTWNLGSYGGSYPVSMAWAGGNTVFILDSLGALNRSDDAGLTWRQAIQQPFPSVSPTAIRFSPDGKTGIILRADAVLRSTDGGDTWTREPLIADGMAIGFSSRWPVFVGRRGWVAIGDGY